MLTSKDSGTARTGNRVAAIIISEYSACLSYAVNIGSRCQLGKRMTICTDGLRGMVVTHDKKNVEWLLLRRKTITDKGRKKPNRTFQFLLHNINKKTVPPLPTLHYIGTYGDWRRLFLRIKSCFYL